jgi:hypothetical protein
LLDELWRGPTRDLNAGILIPASVPWTGLSQQLIKLNNLEMVLLWMTPQSLIKIRIGMAAKKKS